MSIQPIQKGTGATIKGFDKVRKGLKAADKKVDKAFHTAVKVEGFSLKNLLQKEIRQGNPGGKVFSPLSYIAKRLWGKRPNRNPLARLATGVRYQISKSPFKMLIGFVGKGQRGWRKLAQMHQEGFTRSVSEKQQRLIVGKGARLGKVSGGETPFFLRKTTKFFKTPARPIINPFWQAHENRANNNIKSNFKKKLRGLRI